MKSSDAPEGESNIQYLCTAVHAILSFSASISLYFFLFNDIPRQAGMPRNRKGKKRRKNKAKKIKLHELPCTEIVKSGTITVECRLVSEVCSMNFPCHPFTYSTVPRLRCCLCRLKTRRENVPKVNISDNWKMLVKIFICCSIISVKKCRSCHGSLHHVLYRRMLVNFYSIAVLSEFI